MRTKIQQFIKVNNEWLGLPFALFIYYFTPQVLHQFDETAGAYDIGQLQILSFAVVKVLVASFVAWIGFKLNYPLVYRFFIGPMEARILGTEADQLARDQFQVKVSLFIYFAYFAGALWAMQA